MQNGQPAITVGTVGNNRPTVIGPETSQGTLSQFDTTQPTIMGVNSPTANGAYKIGDTIVIQVIFSEAVMVMGIPALALNSGGSAAYDNGSGTDTLNFAYTVQAGDAAFDLDYTSSNALTNSGYIRNPDEKDAILTLPSPGAANSLGANKDLVVDGSAPAVTSVVPTGANIPISGEIVITFGEAMNTSAGKVSLNGGTTALPGSWNDPSNTVFTAAYSGLAWGTPYTVAIKDFKDAAGNDMSPNPDNRDAFTTKAQPMDPNAGPTTFNLDLNGVGREP